MEEVHKADHAGKPQKQSGDLFWKITTLGLIVVLAIVAFKGSFGGNGNQVGVPPTGGAVANPTPIDMEGLLDDDAVKGDKDAPVTIVEWSDYECPFCARFYSETEKLIDEQYVKTGKVRFVYRDYPLPFHQNAQKAAEAAECAGDQGKFWEMHNLLFEQGVAGGVAGFKQFAQQLGLDTSKFNTCLDTGATAAEIQKDMNDGSAVGIQGTPGFIINGKLVSGAQPFSVFKQVIDAELN